MKQNQPAVKQPQPQTIANSYATNPLQLLSRKQPVLNPFQLLKTTATAGKTTQVAQLVLRTRALFNEGIQGEGAQSAQLNIIATNLHNYNTVEPSDDGDFQLRLGALKMLLTSLHEWFDQFKTGSLNTVPNAIYLKSFYADVEQEHQHLIMQIAATDYLPVDTRGMEETEIEKIRKIWVDLLGGTGNIIIHDRSSEAFRKRIMADFARLLEGRFGRDLLHDLNKKREHAGNDIIVGENFADRTGDEERPESEAIPMSSLVKETESAYKLTGSSGDSARMDLPRHDGKNESFDPAAFHDFLISNDDSEKFKWGESAYKKGGGTGSLVRLAGEENENIGIGDTQIIAPGFVTLGHELGHAQRLLRGAPLHNEDFKEMGVTGRVDQLLWNNPEEFVNINAVENRIRSEHNLSRRLYHAGDLGTVKFERERERFESKYERYYETLNQHQKSVLRFYPLLERVQNYLTMKPDYNDEAVVTDIHRQLDKLILDTASPLLVWREIGREIAGNAEVRGRLSRSMKPAEILRVCRDTGDWTVVNVLMNKGRIIPFFEAGLTREEYETKVDPAFNIDVEIEYTTIDPKAWFFKHIRHIYTRKRMDRHWDKEKDKED